MTIVINKQGGFELAGADLEAGVGQKDCAEEGASLTQALAFVDIAASFQPEDLDTLLAVPAIRIVFDSFADGRFLTLCRQLRLKGFKGHLRAAGDMVPDQFPMAVKMGFDSVEISIAHAQRCTEDQWLSHGRRTQGNYQSRVAG